MSFLNPTKLASWAPIDDAARSGKPTLVSDGEFLASAKWTEDGWIHHGSGVPVGFEPDTYLKREPTDG